MAKRTTKKVEAAQDAAEHAAEVATTALVVDIALREGSLIARRAVQRKLAGGNLTDLGDGSKLPRPGFGQRLAAAALARLAARSLPGTLAVVGGLAVKGLLDRRRARKEASKAVEDQG